MIALQVPTLYGKGHYSDADFSRRLGQPIEVAVVFEGIGHALRSSLSAVSRAASDLVDVT